MPASSRHRDAVAGEADTFTPSSANRSALPHLLDTERLPCLATRTPHAGDDQRAPTDEMLNVPPPSPPVPHVSNVSSNSPVSRTLRSRIVRAKPTISGVRSPFIRSADQQAGDLRGRRLAVHDGGHRGRRLLGREVVTLLKALEQRGEHHSSRKLRSSTRPSVVNTDSG